MTVILAIIAAAIVVAQFALTTTSRKVALGVFLALLPTYVVRFSFPIPGIGALPTTMLELLFWGMFFGWLVTDGKRAGVVTSLAAWAMPITLFVTGSVIGVLIAPDTIAALGLWRAYILEPLLFFIVATDVFRTARGRDTALAGLGATTAFVGIIAIIQKFTGIGIDNPFWRDEATRRVTAVYGFPNAIGLFVAPVAVLLIIRGLALIRERRVAPAALAFSAAMLGIIAAFFAASEGALLAMAAGLLLYGLIDRRFRIAALVALIAGCLAVAVIPPLTRYATGVLSLTDDSGRVRRIVWGDTVAMLRDHPVFGAGLSGYPARVAPYHTAHHIEIFQYPHSIVFNFWSEMGVIGLIAFTWLVILFYAHARALARHEPSSWVAAGAVAAMATLLIHGLVDVPYFKNDLAYLFWTLPALVEGARLEAGRPGIVGMLRNLFSRAKV